MIMAVDKLNLSALSAFLILCLEGVTAADYCRTSRYSYSYEYCTYGCCGSYPDEYCCDNLVGIIVGAVIGGIVFICVIIAVICCCIKSQGRAGRVVHQSPNPQSNVTVVHAGGYGMQPGQGYGMQPAPAYGMQPGQGYGMQPGAAPNQPPPAYNYNDPVYPPGASGSNPFAAAAGANQAPGKQ